jgi:hypothetical protein
LYLSWVDPIRISGLAMSSTPLPPSQIIGSSLFDFSDCFSSNFFIFSSRFFSKNFEISKWSVIILRKNEVLMDTRGSEVFEKKNPERGEPVSFVRERELCPLSHLLILSKNLIKKQKDAIQLAIKYGFPSLDLANLEKEPAKISGERLASEWDSMIKFQAGSTESDFLKTLKGALKSLGKEHSRLFQKLHSIIPPTDYSEYSLAPLFAILPYVAARKIEPVPNQPRVGIRTLRFEAILELEERMIQELLSRLRDELSSDFLKVRIFEMGKTLTETRKQDERIFRIRVAIVLESISDCFDLENSVILEREVFYLTIERVLYSVSHESYVRFAKRKIPEFWLKSARISVNIPFSLLRKTRKIIIDFFGSHLCSSKFQTLYKKSERTYDIFFDLCFSMAYDFVIDDKRESIFPDIRVRDKHTQIGIEYLMQKEFDQSLRFFRKAEASLSRSWLKIYPSPYSRKRERAELNGITNSSSPGNQEADDMQHHQIFSPADASDKLDPQELLDMIVTAKKWKQTAINLRNIDKLEKEMRHKTIDKKEYIEKRTILAEMLRGTELRCFKNYFNFVEEIGSFYVTLLQEIEKTVPDSVKKWMRLEI